jgi:small-conductance mechanosensitive channel
MIKIALFLLFTLSFLDAKHIVGTKSIDIYFDLNVSEVELAKEKKEQEKRKEEKLRKEALALQKKKEQKRKQEKIRHYVEKLKAIESTILQEKVWMKSYYSYLTSLEVRNSLKKIRIRIEELKHFPKNTKVEDELSSLISKEKILATQVNRLNKKDSALFSKLLTPPTIGEVIKVVNPFDIFTGISMIKTFDVYIKDYLERKNKLSVLIDLIKKERNIYRTILTLDNTDKYVKLTQEKEKQLERFEVALDTITVSAKLFQKRLEALEANIQSGIKEQTYRLVHIGIIVFFVFFVFLLLKYIIRRYIKDNDRFYMANKVINFVNITLIGLILFFNYIENASYLVTILGFASAGIAIAMKDWFMSILGWLVIVFGGSIHVGDRIRVDMDGMKYVGDVMDISLLRMTILEDITLTSIMQNRRAGRIIFVPNNYIFTRMIANYTHSSLKTVWDGVKVTITFESNHKKAMHIAKEVTKKYSKGYTDITRKQLNKLRHHYSLKNTNVEPRIYSFIEPNGLDIEAWYLTNAYATLTLRSVISTEIIDAFKKEDDIQIAYPTQRLHLQQEQMQMRENVTEELV